MRYFDGDNSKFVYIFPVIPDVVFNSLTPIKS